MYKVIVFGGTTEGRRLHEFLQTHKIPALTCVATASGADQFSSTNGVRVGRLDKTDMTALIIREHPMLVIDATHPYATEASVNIKAACRDAGMEYIRVLRERCAAENCFPSLDALIEELKSTEGQIFVTLGAKAAMKLTELPDYQNRLWLRILPSADGLNTCLDLGYPARRLICMQGPFSTELNIAMLRQTGAKALV
ncbi:MAG: precorrin-6A/cobalt-precorrin-6A reductase, partial [Oscillospiraceae bacterium]|nr:precorrin-6A/cobalt-precorrin-6A reductase [Oscillospiraceae bacterium]